MLTCLHRDGCAGPVAAAPRRMSRPAGAPSQRSLSARGGAPRWIPSNTPHCIGGQGHIGGQGPLNTLLRDCWSFWSPSRVSPGHPTLCGCGCRAFKSWGRCWLLVSIFCLGPQSGGPGLLTGGGVAVTIRAQSSCRARVHTSKLKQAVFGRGIHNIIFPICPRFFLR